jgi:CrcB protein
MAPLVYHRLPTGCPLLYGIRAAPAAISRSIRLNNFALVFLGSGIGGALRHGVNVLAPRLLGIAFPWSTLGVNVVGSLMMGVLAGYFAATDGSQAWRLFLTTGIMGGFTTFSAFSLETVLLYERGQLGAAIAYVLASVLVSVVALFVGLALARATS